MHAFYTPFAYEKRQNSPHTNTTQVQGTTGEHDCEFV